MLGENWGNTSQFQEKPPGRRLQRTSINISLLLPMETGPLGEESVRTRSGIWVCEAIERREEEERGGRRGREEGRKREEERGRRERQKMITIFHLPSWTHIVQFE